MKTAEQLAAEFADADLRARVADAFSLSRLPASAFSGDGLDQLAELADSIELTAAGEAACSAVAEHETELDAGEIRLGAFLAFYWTDLLVDVEATDLDAIAKRVGDLIAEGLLRFPWLYGRQIDDVYLSKYNVYNPEINADETVALIDELPQGVFQLGRFVTGPFGLLNSRGSRWLIPGRTGPVFGCTDPGCDGLHVVNLTRPESRLREAEKLVDQASAAAAGERPSQWRFFLPHLILDDGRDYHHDDLIPALLAPFIPNALSDVELNHLTRIALEHHAEHLRGMIPAEGELADRFRNSPETIVADLGAPECLQLLFVAADDVLIECIERAVDADAIHVPPTERRNLVVARTGMYNGMYEVNCELGPAGLRFRPRIWTPSVAMRLRRLIDQIYPDEEGRVQLEWKLRALAAPTPEDRVDLYLATTSPEKAVNELLFESRARLEAAFTNLRWGRFAVPTTPDEEQFLRDRILWKLGANIFNFPSALQTFWDRIGALRTLARELHSPYSETEREALRGPGTNVFVSFEGVLDRAICFVTWALLNDHWHLGKRDRFVYTPRRARSYAASILDGRRLTGSDVLRFDASGKNNLFPLTQAFGVLADVCDEIRQHDASRYERPDSDLPHYLQPAGLERFPFLHVHPILDLRPEAADSITAALRRIPSTLDRAGVLDVRNRIPHNREPFPSQEEIDRASVAVEEVVELLESVGMAASPHVFESETADRYARTVTRLVDYAGRKFDLLEPSPLRMSEVPQTEVPQLIFTAARLGGTSETLRFAYFADSEYLDRWSGFPTAATIPPDSAVANVPLVTAP